MRVIRLSMGICIASIAACSGESSTDDFFASDPKFQQIQVLGAFPARRASDGSWGRVCGTGASDGVVVDVELLSSPRGGADNDLDASIRPGDEIDDRLVDGQHSDDIVLSGTTNLDVQLDCFNVATTAGNSCVGATSQARGSGPTYVANAASRAGAHDVIVLHPRTADLVGSITNAATRFVAILNPRDTATLIEYGETSIGVEPDGSEVIGSGSRSNLWGAVAKAIDTLEQEPAATGRTRDIVVFTDGRDTCGGESRESCRTPCSGPDFRELVDRVARAENDPVHIDFIQLGSARDPERDPRQMEMACVSGGEYQFVNLEALLSRASDAPQEAIDVAAANVRYSLMGHWQVGVSVDSGLPVGAMYALQGAVTVAAGSQLVTSDKTFPFGYGQGQGATDATQWDRRPAIRSACQSFLDCGAIAAPGACQFVCSSETLTCTPGAAPISEPDLAACDDDGSGAGFCCGGACIHAGECAVCVDP